MKKVFNMVLICVAVLSILTMVSCKEVNHARPDIDSEGVLPQDGEIDSPNADESSVGNNQNSQDNTNSENSESEPNGSLQDNKETESNGNSSSVTKGEEDSVTNGVASGSTNNTTKDDNKNKNENKGNTMTSDEDEEVIIDDENPSSSGKGSSGGSNTNTGNNYNNIWGNNTNNNWGTDTGINIGNTVIIPDKKEPMPWENGGKQPSEYTWVEFRALTSKQQKAFAETFDTKKAFETWLDNAIESWRDSIIQGEDSNSSNDQTYPWDNGGKQPSEYTWEEYEALTPIQQVAFHNSFASIDDFDAWMKKAQSSNIYKPWENGGKQPNEYTWAEFEALTAVQQMAFQNSFASTDDFDAWMERVHSGDVYYPWENGGKQPGEYTWAEFEALTTAQQMAFQNSFANADEFDAWMERAQSVGAFNPWENGGKQPWEYTWAEFEALTRAQQMAFQNSFASINDFDAWLQKAQSGGELNPWENGGKQPWEYTWAEFQSLTAAQQMAFQNSFASINDFDAWMKNAQSGGELNPWEIGGKQPWEYTWAEFQALTAAQQMAFQNSFASINEFDAWLQRAQSGGELNPWEIGGKQPWEYTWAEFQALTAAQQMAFQNSFASIDEFDAWLQNAQSDGEFNLWGNDGEQLWQ